MIREWFRGKKAESGVQDTETQMLSASDAIEQT